MLPALPRRARALQRSSHIYLACLSKPATLRRFSTSHLEPPIREFTRSIAQTQPCFAMSSHDTDILSEPTQFYQLLLDMIHRAQRRIFISTLYIGENETALIEALHLALRENPFLHLYLQLDFNRSTRPGLSSTTLALLPLLRDFPDRVHISLFRSPKLRGIMSKLVPPRFNEGWGTWHAKIYGADDEVLISGANLSKSYFTDRQDRYFHFKAQPALAQYCFSFLQTVSTFSYQVLLPNSPGDRYSLRLPDPYTHPHDIQSKAERVLSDFQSSQLALSSMSVPVEDKPNKDEVLVFPIIQAGQFNIREEEQCLSLLFNHIELHKRSLPFRPLMDLTSGYFGLYKKYQDLILQSSIPCRIVAASPKANGFYESRGISGLIPEGYTYLEQLFMTAVRTARRNWVAGREKDLDTGVQLNEWERNGWTYHAKGIWLSPSPDAAPILTLFGSTNLNSRSSNLDTELSFIMITSSPLLRQRLQQEVQALRVFARPWTGESRKVRWRTMLLVGIVGGML